MGQVLEDELVCDPILNKDGLIHSDLGNSLGHICKYVKYVDLLT